MNKPNQRKDSASNASVGDEFEKTVQEYFQGKEGIALERGYSLRIGLESKKDHKFDLGYSDGERTIIIECKSHTWTEENKIPRARLSLWNEAMYLFYLAPKEIEKRMVVLRDFSRTRQETLAQYYLRTYSHLIPKDVSFYEFNQKTGEMKQIKKASADS